MKTIRECKASIRLDLDTLDEGRCFSDFDAGGPLEVIVI
jgi:hypothetical protein